MTRRALGRGLSALLSDVPDKSESKEELKEVDIDQIDPNPEQPRNSFADDKLEELAQSIRVNGLVQPLLVRRKENGRYQIVAGERRWRASQRAGLHKVSVVIKDVTDDKLLEIALIENIQRQELNPIEEASAYDRLVDGLGLTQDEVAQRVGKDRSSVANYMRLLRLQDSVQEMLVLEQLSMGHARALLGLTSNTEQMSLAEEIVKKKLSVRETERLVQLKNAVGNKSDNSTQLEKDANIRAAELKLKRYLGAPVKIQLGRNGGKIQIDFGSAIELDRIYSIIMGKNDSSAPSLP